MLRIIACCMIVSSLNTLVYADEPKQVRQISMTGEASAMMAPDMATISIGVETEGTNIADLKSDNDLRVRAIYDAVKGLGVATKDIQTSDLSIQPIYDQSSKRRKLIRYEMRNMVIITVRNLGNVERIINASVREGSNVLEGVSFGLSTRERVSDSLQIEAARNAQKRATELAGAVGAKLGKPLVISASREHFEEPTYGRGTYMLRASAMAEVPSTPVSGGEMKIRSTVSITFELE